MSRIETVRLQHDKVSLALHHLREPLDGHATHPLLYLHGLGEQTPDSVPDEVAEWPGAIWGLDVTGHGESTVPIGGGYLPEVLSADVDHALAHIGPATVYGRGLGGYLALLIAGARPELIRGAVIADGPGLVGGGIRPSNPTITILDVDPGDGAPDPYALFELSRAVRPADYAVTYVHLAVDGSRLDEPISVCTIVRPEWIDAIVNEPGVRDTTVAQALADYAAS